MCILRGVNKMEKLWWQDPFPSWMGRWADQTVLLRCDSFSTCPPLPLGRTHPCSPARLFQAIENDCIQDFMYHGVHLPRRSPVHPRVRKVSHTLSALWKIVSHIFVFRELFLWNFVKLSQASVKGIFQNLDIWNSGSSTLTPKFWLGKQTSVVKTSELYSDNFNYIFGHKNV